MGRRLPCRPRRTLSLLAVLVVLLGSIGFFLQRAPKFTTDAPQLTIAPLALSHSANASGAGAGVLAGQHGEAAGPATGGGSMCLSGATPVADISSEQLSKMEQCLAIPPQVVRKPSSKALLEGTTNAPVPSAWAASHARARGREEFQP